MTLTFSAWGPFWPLSPLNHFTVPCAILTFLVVHAAPRHLWGPRSPLAFGQPVTERPGGGTGLGETGTAVTHPRGRLTPINTNFGLA
jgi:hypothetical protein